MRVLVRRKYPTEGGIQLAADVYLPEGPGPFPVILCRTPYDRVGHLGPRAPGFVNRGYAYVAADCRGRYESEGEYTRPFEEVVDGQATIEWIAGEKWCNGRIGMWGRSYGGLFQVPAAVGGHEAIRCICPSIVCSRFFPNWARYDGCFALRNPLWWIISNGVGRTQPPMAHFDIERLQQMKTIDEVEEAAGFELRPLRDVAEHDTEDEFWASIDQWPMHSKIEVPGLHVGGWFDHVSRGAYEGYQRIRDLGATEAARAGQRLFIGPWGHMSLFGTGDAHRRYGIWDFGQAADVPVIEHELRFFDLHLKDMDDGISEEPPVRIFLMGPNQWIDLPDWPPPDAAVQYWHLDSAGNAHGQRGDGVLTREPPGRTAEDLIVYDPCSPLPTWGGQVFWNMEPRGPQDQSQWLERDDVLLYRSDPLLAPLTVVGDVELDITLATDVDDTDIVAKLCVVEDNGSVTCLTVGSFRCRYREGWDKRVPMEHGEPTPIGLHLMQLAYTFPAGSRIAVMVTSSDYPRIQPHTNTMAKPWTAVTPVVARTRLSHGPGIRAALKLPVLAL
ncbi:CocE/NonD family hydrolase [Verrucomicrobiota bacterium]